MPELPLWQSRKKHRYPAHIINHCKLSSYLRQPGRAALAPALLHFQGFNRGPELYAGISVRGQQKFNRNAAGVGQAQEFNRRPTGVCE
jgi:hypothetical protein